ncbi:MAG: helix-turn-helix domain-containing protein [Actinomycetota bacterium]
MAADTRTSSSLTADEFSAAVTAITSAFGDPTRRDIYLFARESEEGVTAAQVAARVDLHANVARHHLDKLAAGGYVEVALGRTSTGAGRPSKRYVVADAGMALEFPVRRDDLLGALLGRALALLPHDQAEALAEEVGIEYGQALAEGMEPNAAQRSFRAAAGAVAEALTSHGFAARTEKSGDALRIVSEHCPFGDAALEHPVICAIDRGLVKGMLAGLHGGGEAEVLLSRPDGAKHCITSLGGI